jgi:hypothetical protein
MTRIWKLIGSTSLLAAVLAAAPIQADDASKSTDKPDDVQKQLKELKSSVAELKTSMDGVKEVLESLKNLQGEVKQFHADYDREKQDAKRELANLKDEISHLKLDIENLRKSPTNAARESGFAPGMTGPGVNPVPTGRVQLSNTWSAPVSVIVNGRSYQVLPGEVKFTDPVPAGTFSYEVVGITAPNNVRTLVAGETYRINVYPRQTGANSAF